MKTYKELYLCGDREALALFENIVVAQSINDWEIVSNQDVFTEDFIIFKYSGDEVNKANVFLYTKHNSKYRVTNIVPTEKDRLDYDEYNEVLDKCVAECIHPYANKYGLKVELTSGRANLEDYMSDESAKKLKLFSVAANKSTGSSHPNDSERWNDFLCQVFVEGSHNVTTILGKWLSNQGWDEEQTEKLVCECEFALELLAYYRERYNG